MAKITVLTTDVNVITISNEDYICITDMLKAKDGDFFIADWLRNRNTLEYLGIWERLYNPNFNYGEFATIRNQAGLNSFKISVKEYVERTKAIGIQAKAGRYGGTYAHKVKSNRYPTNEYIRRHQQQENTEVNSIWNYN